MNATTSSSGKRRWPPRVLLIVVLLLIAAWQAPRFFPVGGDAKAALPVEVTPELLKQGEYLARAGDCAACHSAPGGQPFAGGLAIASPIGNIYSSNITPDADTGIGQWSYGDFERAVRRGVSHSGKPLYPAMPFPSYARISDADIAALYAYFIHGVAPVKQANRGSDIPWPLSLRWPLAYWRVLFAPSVESLAKLPQAGDPVVARGAYLVEGLGHCGACHTPRALTLQEKSLSDGADKLFLSGGAADNWIAPSLRGNVASGIGKIDEAHIAEFLKSGRTADTAAFGGMADVVQHSTQYLSDADLTAIARYLKTLAPTHEETAGSDDGAIAKALYAAQPPNEGARLYLDNCATCHRTHGQGYEATYPALAGNPAVNGADPTSLLHLVLNGSAMPSTQAAPTAFAMPAFGARLSDAEVAEVVSFVRASWGNSAGPVDAAQVHKLRAALPPPGPVYSQYDPRNPAQP